MKVQGTSSSSARRRAGAGDPDLAARGETMVDKSLDVKLRRLHADPRGCTDFILADAKDADMALAIGAPGRSPEAHSGELRYRSLAEFRDIIEQIVEQGLIDIMLMSASTNEALTIQKRIFDRSPVTPAARANDTTDIHIVRGSQYPLQPSLPFRTATLDHIQCGRLQCKPEERHLGANLGLYSITFNNDAVLDREALEQYKQFRLEAEAKGFRHFLEVFDPNRPEAMEASQVPGFINDAIVRTLGGVTSAGRPLFLKMVYHGPRAMEELVHYDPHLIVGILGGSAGTTYDAFKLLSEARKYGARVALFGRKINNAENQLAFIRFLRLIADGEITAEEAVRAYHGVLQQLGIRPQRSLEEDMQIQTSVMSYGGNGVVVSGPVGRHGRSAEPATAPEKHEGCACRCAEPANNPAPAATEAHSNEPDFTQMTPAQKIAYQGTLGPHPGVGALAVRTWRTGRCYRGGHEEPHATHNSYSAYRNLLPAPRLNEQARRGPEVLGPTARHRGIPGTFDRGGAYEHDSGGVGHGRERRTGREHGCGSAGGAEERKAASPRARRRGSGLHWQRQGQGHRRRQYHTEGAPAQEATGGQRPRLRGAEIRGGCQHQIRESYPAGQAPEEDRAGHLRGRPKGRARRGAGEKGAGTRGSEGRDHRPAEREDGARQVTPSRTPRRMRPSRSWLRPKQVTGPQGRGSSPGWRAEH